MKKSFVILGLILLALVIYGVSVYNTMITKQQGVKTAWSQVENVYQRRADLIPNLVNTVKGYAAHEKQTLTSVIDARSKALQTQQNIQLNTVPSPEQIQQMEAAQQTLGAALGRLLLLVERYPDLKANQNFLALQAELAGTENRIAVERRRFNISAQEYNVYILQFPHNFMSRLFGFQSTAYFTAKPNSDVAPVVNFVQ